MMVVVVAELDPPAILTIDALTRGAFDVDLEVTFSDVNSSDP